jgi:Icc-related predicted phosphoesterase
MWVSMYIKGYRGKDHRFTLCTSHSFSNGYVIGQDRYQAIPRLDSLIATSLLRKLKSGKIKCLAPDGNCDNDPAVQSFRKRDLILLESYLQRRRYR